LLFNTEVSFALKNTSGQYEIKDISLFEMERINKHFSDIEMHINRSNKLSFTVKCTLCGDYHSYSYNLNDVIKRDMVIGGCESLGMPLFFIGNKIKVHQRIKSFNEIRRSTWAMM
jgi:hypothetical protein